jgi:HTH-type transcriptional regulator/antitoxin HigA
MASTAKCAQNSDRDHYLELIQRFALRPLRSAEELTEAIKVIDSLISRGDLDSAEQDYLDILTDIVEKYEADAQPMPAVSDSVMLRHLIEARGITQSRLADSAGIAMSTISEILSGKRRLTRMQVAKVSEYLGISPYSFAPAPLEDPAITD